MSIKISTAPTADAVVAQSVKSGENWEMIKVKGTGKDRKTVTLWVDNRPSGIREGDSFKVTKIVDVKYASKQLQDGTWRDEFSMNVHVQKVGPGGWTPPPQEPQGDPTFYPVNEDDEGLPFD